MTTPRVLAQDVFTEPVTETVPPGRHIFDDGETIGLLPCTCARLHAGDHTTWVVHVPLRKVYLAG